MNKIFKEESGTFTNEDGRIDVVELLTLACVIKPG